jgi:hypothetical protein
MIKPHIRALIVWFSVRHVQVCILTQLRFVVQHSFYGRVRKVDPLLQGREFAACIGWAALSASLRCVRGIHRYQLTPGNNQFYFIDELELGVRLGLDLASVALRRICFMPKKNDEISQ